MQHEAYEWMTLQNPLFVEVNVRKPESWPYTNGEYSFKVWKKGYWINLSFNKRIYVYENALSEYLK